MAKYQYKGRSKIVSEVPKRKTSSNNPIIDECSFVIIASYPIAGVRKLGCPLINEHYDDQVLDLHLDLINSICGRPNIMVVAGFDVKKLFKYKRRNEFQIIENTIFEFTNSSEDLRIALNALQRNYTIVLDGAFLLIIDTYKLLLKDPNISKIVYSKRESQCVGLNITEENIVNYFGYKCENKTKGAYYLSMEDFDKIRKRTFGSSFNKNRFDYEMLEELKMTAVEDKSKSMRLDENYDISDQ